MSGFLHLKSSDQLVASMKLRPRSSFFRIFTDGASRGNPGPSGAGAALYTPTNAIYARLSRYLGHQTNNAAEYHAVLHGLALARSMHVSRILVLSDSQLLVHQMLGRYAVLSPSLALLHQRLSDITTHFDVCRFAFVRRHHNVEADRLANLAIDQDVPLQLFLDTDDCVDEVRKRLEQFQSEHAQHHKAVS